MPKQVKVDVIPYDAKINIVVPGSFYARIQSLTLFVTALKDNEAAIKALMALKEKKEPADEYEMHVHTLTLLVHEIEKQAKEQKLMQVREMTLDDNDNFVSVSES